MAKNLSRETRKLEVRLEEYIKEEKEFIKELKKCLDKFGKVNIQLERMKTLTSPTEVKNLMIFRLEAIKAICDVMIKKSVVDHEQSHLSESYGTLIITLEETFQNLYSTNKEK
jgi:hypothetical protein